MADTVAEATIELEHLIDVALDVVSRGENAQLADWPDISTAIDALIAAVRAESAEDISLLKRDRQIALNAALDKARAHDWKDPAS